MVTAADASELEQLKEKCVGQPDAEAYISSVLQAVSGTAGVHNSKAIMAENVAETAKDAETPKAEGNRLFAAGDYEGAIFHYQKAFNLFNEYSPAQYDAATRKFLVVVYSNCAQAYLRLADQKEETGEAQDLFECARMTAEKALELDSANVKARFRRGCAQAKRKEWSLARADFEWVLRLEPENVAAKKELRVVLKQLQSEKGSGPKWSAALDKSTGADPRIAESEKKAAKIMLDKHLASVSHLRVGGLKYWESKGRREEWETKMEELEVRANELSQQVIQTIASVEDKDLSSVLGEKGVALAQLDSEQRCEYMKADAFVTVLKQECGADFADMVAYASERMN